MTRSEVQKTENIYDLVDSAVGQIKPGAEGVIFLPYLMGERTPWWNIKAKGCWIGLHQHTDWRVMARSLMEGIAMNLAYTYSIFSSSENIERTRLIGGAARTKALVQIIADNLQLPIDTLKYLEESTSLGAAMIGGVGVSLYDSFDQVLDFNPISKTVLPNRDTKELYAKLKTIFDKAYHQNSAIFDLLFAFNEQYPFD